MTEMITTLTLDMKKQRIRIHKKMLEELNRPEYIVILVNPYKSTIAVVPMETGDKDTLKVSYDDSECEYYSKKLMSHLTKIRIQLDQSCTYRIKGKVINHGMALFDMHDAVRFSDPPDNETNTTGRINDD